MNSFRYNGLKIISFQARYAYCYVLLLPCENCYVQKLIYETTIQSKITMAGEVVPYYTVTALVPTLK